MFGACAELSQNEAYLPKILWWVFKRENSTMTISGAFSEQQRKATTELKHRHSVGSPYNKMDMDDSEPRSFNPIGMQYSTTFCPLNKELEFSELSITRLTLGTEQMVVVVPLCFLIRKSSSHTQSTSTPITRNQSNSSHIEWRSINYNVCRMSIRRQTTTSTHIAIFGKGSSFTVTYSSKCVISKTEYSTVSLPQYTTLATKSALSLLSL